MHYSSPPSGRTLERIVPGVKSWQVSACKSTLKEPLEKQAGLLGLCMKRQEREREREKERERERIASLFHPPILPPSLWSLAWRGWIGLPVREIDWVMMEGTVPGEGEVSERGGDLPGTVCVRRGRGEEEEEMEEWRCEHSDAPSAKDNYTGTNARASFLLRINVATTSQADSTSCLCLCAVRCFRLVFLSYNCCCSYEHVQRLLVRLQSHTKILEINDSRFV